MAMYWWGWSSSCSASRLGHHHQNLHSSFVVLGDGGRMLTRRCGGRNCGTEGRVVVRGGGHPE